MNRRIVLAVGLLALALATGAWLPAATAEAASAEAMTRLRAGGHVLLIRHARTTPGVGDPPGFIVEDCTTQRNLSDAGRTESAALGRMLSEAGVIVGDVLSSRWCRALDTARFAFARVTPWPALDSFFGDRAAEAVQTAAVRQRIGSWKGPGTLVLVTHQVNISAIAGEFMSMGEGLVLAPDGGNGFAVVARLRSPAR